jgi:GNAT superfamily N-acetyltransferase
MSPGKLDQLDVIDAGRLPQLLELFAGQWWTAGRGPDEVRGMLAGSDIVVGLRRRDDDQLVAFARVLTDFTYLAIVLDVIVASAVRGRGVGALLMEAVLARPGVADVANVELVCQPGVQAFYHRWGFTERVGASRLMRRTSDQRLLSGEPPGYRQP